MNQVDKALAKRLVMDKWRNKKDNNPDFLEAVYMGNARKLREALRFFLGECDQIAVWQVKK